MIGSWSEILFLFLLMVPYLAQNMLSKSVYFFTGNLKNDTHGGKVLEVQTLGILSCAVSCLQNENCSFFSLNNGICSGYDYDRGDFVPEADALDHAMFSIYQTQEKLTQGDYRALGSSGKYVKLHETYKTWDDALQTCQAEGATLVKPDTEKIRSALNEMFIPKSRNDRFWIGLSDKYDNDTWYWTDGSVLGSKPESNWNCVEPHNFRDGLKENCAFTLHHNLFGVRWADSPCNYTIKFVCEKIDEA